MTPLIIAITSAGFSVLGAALSAMNLHALSSLDNRVRMMEEHLLRGNRYVK